MKEIAKLGDLTPNPRNSNRGTERGREMLEKSLRKLGAGRSIVVDRNGVVIGGNHVLEVAAELGLPVQTVQSDGKTLVVVQRLDLDLSEDKVAIELAHADNRVQEINFEVDPVRLAEDLQGGVDLSDLYSGKEIAQLLKDVPGVDLDDKKSSDILKLEIDCEDAEQRNLILLWLDTLKKKHPSARTIGGRIAAFLTEFALVEQTTKEKREMD
jgi:hypothetical protein